MIAAALFKSISKKAAFALACGIVSDTARFKSAKKETFAILAKLMEKSGASYAEIMKFAEADKKKAERIALLKGFQRVKFTDWDRYLIATTEVGSHGSDVASMLAEAAHVAFVADWKDEARETRVSARASKDFPVPLNEILSKVAKDLGGNGGGHPKAAGCSVPGKKPDEVLKKCIDAVKESLKNMR
jgi:nanoRNase/pAp phosphatase (c-di-AMP/oligoRNAs hydrolase)